jgi:Chaperone of endosialidase
VKKLSILISILSSLLVLVLAKPAQAQISQTVNSFNGVAINGLSQGLGASFGVQGQSTGNSATAYGVVGTSTYSYGGYFTTTANAYGVGALRGDATGSAATAVVATNEGAGTGLYAACVKGSGSCSAVYTSGDVTVNGNITATGTVTGGSSDARLKKNIKPVTGALEDLLKLKGVTFEWIDPAEHADQTDARIGFVAQDVEQVFPTWIGEDPRGFKTVNVQQIEALEVEAIRSLKAENDGLKARMKSLEERRSVGPKTGDLGMGLGGLGVAFGCALAFSRRRRSA